MMLFQFSLLISTDKEFGFYIKQATTCMWLMVLLGDGVGDRLKIVGMLFLFFQFSKDGPAFLLVLSASFIQQKEN